MCNDIWRQLVQVHQKVKDLTIKAEEEDEEFRTFLPPLNEQRNALEHIIRAYAGKLKIKPDCSQEYINKNLDKALGHEYRAFFDIADFMNMKIREKVRNALKSYSNKCITEVIPNYYNDIRPRIEQITSRIVEIRKRKDILTNDSLSEDEKKTKEKILREVDQYENEINSLLKIAKDIEQTIPALEEFTEKEKLCALQQKQWDIKKSAIIAIFGLVCTVLASFITYLFLR